MSKKYRSNTIQEVLQKSNKKSQLDTIVKIQSLYFNKSLIEKVIKFWDLKRIYIRSGMGM
jgi:hypothetical protein